MKRLQPGCQFIKAAGWGKLAAVLVLCLSVLLPSVPLNRAQAAPVVASAAGGAQSYYYKFGSLVTLQGVFGANDYYFNVDRQWDVSRVTLHLDISQSQRIDTLGLSSLTIFLNGEPVKTVPLKDYMPEHSTLDYTFDNAKVKTGSNDVKVQAYRRIGDLPCADDVSDANWLNIFADSGVNVEYTDKTPTMNLCDFPYPFYRLKTGAALNTAVTISDTAGTEETGDALELASYFGRLAGSNDVTLTTVPLGALQDKTTDNIIYIGKKDSVPADWLKLFPQWVDFSKGAGIGIVRSPYDQNHVMMMVLADQTSDLKRAVKFLQNASLTQQVRTNFYLLTRDVDVMTKDEPQTGRLSFTSLGYNGIYVYGPFRKTANLAFLLPKNRILDDQSSITLNFRYAANLDFKRSLVTVFVNNIPIGSKKLTAEKVNGDTMTLSIPKEARQGNYFNLKVAFDLEIEGEWCTFRQQDMPWAYVQGESVLYLPTTQVLANLFENFPNPFISNNMWNNTAFVFPEKPAATELDEAGTVAVMMGHDLRSNHGDVNAVIGSLNSEALKTANLVAIGTPSRQDVIRRNNASLFFQYDGDFAYFVSNAKKELLKDYSKTLSAFELLQSPYNRTNAMLVLTAPDGSNLKNAIDALFQPSKFAKLIGDGSLVDQSGIPMNYRFKKDTVQKPTFWAGSILSSGNRIFIVVAASVILLLLITLLLFLRKNRKLRVKYSSPKK